MLVRLVKTLDYGLDDRGSIPSREMTGFFSSWPQHPDRLWSSYSQDKTAGAWSWLHLHLVPRLRMRGAIPPLPQYVFMACCLVKHRDNFTLPTLNYTTYLQLMLWCVLEKLQIRWNFKIIVSRGISSSSSSSTIPTPPPLRPLQLS
jgi:hypothetical protein